MTDPNEIKPLTDADIAELKAGALEGLVLSHSRPWAISKVYLRLIATLEARDQLLSETLNNVVGEMQQFRQAFVIAAGDKSPFCQQALAVADSAITALGNMQNLHSAAAQRINPMAEIETDGPRDHDFFGLEEDADGNEIGTPFKDFVTAVSIWASMQPKPPTVADAMLTFNCTQSVVEKACADHYWIILCGDPTEALQQTIEHDGL